MIDIRQLPNLTIEQKNFVDRFYAQFDYAPAGSGLLRHIANVEPLLYEGISTGLNLQVYDVTRLWLIFSLYHTCSAGANINLGSGIYFDENNVVCVYGQNNSICYDSVAPDINYYKNNIAIKNIYFSRLLDGEYNYIKLIGYRITLN